ncbi:gamma-glutamylcyclotransferase [Roseomonas sp. SSH11]|uniref:glutathione-specific gamma-glutamylcyclotransferase n=1 Tax=Pararoseomonas baculiformis TaxID=2820812 RepID=A0ABS4AH56_9PROT|nr:gamma-glutamylcyclotransferase [Pararoseomonas baculiformis]MBP0446353.1 gamma-glutamylcyclotransferase [Pararoseomonas baculiformis]
MTSTAPHPPVIDPAGLDPAPLLDADGCLYVFGYGSLIWKPGFAFESVHPALLRGFHRRFCILSHRYRGTPEVPGLVLGLDRGGACRGVAFRVAAGAAAEVLAYLDEREMSGGVYHRRLLPVRLLDGGGTRQAVTFVADRRARSYCGALPPDAAAAAIARGHGVMGPNRDYLLNTVAHLRALGVRDAGLDRIAALLEPAPGG